MNNEQLRRLGTIKFRDGRDIALFQDENDGSYFKRETWPERKDLEEGYTIYAQSCQQYISSFQAYCLCREFFGEGPENCWCEFWVQNQ